MKCEKCGKEIDETVKFCPECGFENSKLDTCPKCETKVDKSTKFCPNCGIKFETDKDKRTEEKKADSQSQVTKSLETEKRNEKIDNQLRITLKVVFVVAIVWMIIAFGQKDFNLIILLILSDLAIYWSLCRMSNDRIDRENKAIKIV